MPVQLLQQIVYASTSPDYTRTAPAADVRPVVDEFFLYRFRRVFMPELALNNGLPVLLFWSGTGTRLAHSKHRSSSALLVGPVVEQEYVQITGEAGYAFGVRFALCGLYALLGETAAMLRHRHRWTMQELWGREGERLAGRIAAAESFTEKQNTIEEFVRQQQRGAHANPLFEEAVRVLDSSKGRESIDDICRALQINYKWLERYFRKYLGITPKEYGRLQRFTHAFFEVQHADTVDIPDIALRYGYYDQSHFTKEFRRFTGRSPGEYSHTYRRFAG